MTAITQPALSHLRALEAEAIHVMREVAAEREKPALLFSGGKDSIVLVRLAAEGLRAGRASRSRCCTSTPGTTSPRSSSSATACVAELGLSAARRLRAGVDRQRPRARGDRPARVAQPPADVDAARRDRASTSSTPCFGGARRDEERARAKERVLCFRDDFGQLGPAPPAPRAVGPLQRARAPRREHPRVPDLQLDRARRLAVHRPGGARAAVDLHGPRARGVRARRDALRASATFIELMDGEEPFTASVRYRTVGDMSCTGAVRSTAATLSDVVAEIAATNITERGETRADDRASEAAMEDRKRRATSSWTSCASPPPARVDDGKSTLIGRLLYDAKAVLADQLAHVEERSVDGARPRAAHRRPARRARAGHHDRRRLPLVRHAAAALHPRRLPRPRAVHAQHGHRRLDRRPRAAAGRRARRR